MENEQRIFMHSVIKQCSNFFLNLHRYCEEYSERMYSQEKLTKKTVKKNTAQLERRVELTKKKRRKRKTSLETRTSRRNR